MTGFKRVSLADSLMNVPPSGRDSGFVRTDFRALRRTNSVFESRYSNNNPALDLLLIAAVVAVVCVLFVK